MSVSHVSVLMTEILSVFQGRLLKVFVDATVGAGGHAAALLEAHPELEVFVGIDQDPVALKLSRQRLARWEDKVVLVAGNFADVIATLPSKGILQADGILFDLGVSSMQLDQAEKGFSFMRDGPLDMRMNPEGDVTAADIVNTYSELELGRIFREYGEEKQWRAAARVIVAARMQHSINTTHELVAVLRPIFSWKKKGINPLTLIFQALRICVNRELEVLEEALPLALDFLVSGGRLGVISFHSLEDRIVKNAFRFAASDKHETTGLGGVFRDKVPIAIPVTKKPIIPGPEEIASNSRSRSAKFRVVEKC